MKAYSNRDYALSEQYFEQAFKLGTPAKHELYNAALISSMNKNQENAFKYLRLAIEKGWDDPVAIVQNEGFLYLHQFDQWKNNFAAIEKGVDEPLQKKLLMIYANDQKMIQNISSINPQIPNYKAVLDSMVVIQDSMQNAHLQIITQALDTKGFISKLMVGTKASQVPFLVIQHSNLTTQKKYFGLFKDAAERGLFDNKLLALLEDRILVFEKKEQLYGSQLFYDKSDSTYYFYPIADIQHLVQRRQSMNLNSIQEYAAMYNIVWSLKDYLKNLKKSKRRLKKGFDKKFTE
ncbi:DUF6624 domain-containing protein [Emticicia sp. C21]|uniref:DUF6624 domain-containing protein n=1 Tax=Emticicia sp. C21 TaxID=2302915 RepID=UPI000E341ED2|nr:DUF6624 domain-containing protein [Emticicia sp. C21]